MRYLVSIVVFSLMVVLIGFIVLKRGVISFQADMKPSTLEAEIAMSAVDASTERHAAGIKNPLEPSEENLMAGLKVYKSNCLGCHGGADEKENTFGGNFYPAAPQFVSDKADMPENQNFYLIKHGIRWTGMPAWGSMLNDSQIWQVTTFLAHMDKLPPKVDQEWKKKESH